MSQSSRKLQSPRVPKRRKRNQLPYEPVAQPGQSKTATIESFARTCGPHLARQIRSARAWRYWTRSELALRAHVSVSTIRRLESTDFDEFRSSIPTILRVVQALEMSGVIFKDRIRSQITKTA